MHGKHLASININMDPSINAGSHGFEDPRSILRLHAAASYACALLAAWIG